MLRSDRPPLLKSVTKYSGISMLLMSCIYGRLLWNMAANITPFYAALLYNYLKRYDLSTYGRKTTGLKLGQSCPTYAMNAYGGSGCKAPIIPYLAIRWTWLISLKPWHLYTLRKCSMLPHNRIVHNDALSPIQ